MDRPHLIFNCNETGFSRKEATLPTKVVGVKGLKTKQVELCSLTHVTLEVCINAAGSILPTMVIFEGSMPSIAAQNGWKQTWTYGATKNGKTYFSIQFKPHFYIYIYLYLGYVNTDIFYQWFMDVFLPNCGDERPVML